MKFEIKIHIHTQHIIYTVYIKISVHKNDKPK